MHRHQNINLSKLDPPLSFPKKRVFVLKLNFVLALGIT